MKELQPAECGHRSCALGMYPILLVMPDFFDQADPVEILISRATGEKGAWVLRVQAISAIGMIKSNQKLGSSII